MRAILLLTVAALLGGSPVLGAQRTWLDPMPDRGLNVVAALGIFGSSTADVPTGTVAVRGRISAGRNLVATVEFPFARASRTIDPPFGPSRDESATAIGNPWIGFETTPRDGFRLEVGIRPAIWSPDTEEGALPWGFGGVIDFDRWEAWFPRVSSLRFAAELGTVPASGPFGIVRLGGTGYVPRGGGSGEIFADYGVRLGVASPALIASVGVIGHGVLTSGSGSVADRTLHQGELRLVARTGRLRPDLAVRKFVGEPGLDGVKAIVLVGVSLAR